MSKDNKLFEIAYTAYREKESLSFRKDVCHIFFILIWMSLASSVIFSSMTVLAYFNIGLTTNGRELAQWMMGTFISFLSLITCLVIFFIFKKKIAITPEIYRSEFPCEGHNNQAFTIFVFPHNMKQNFALSHQDIVKLGKQFGQKTLRLPYATKYKDTFSTSVRYQIINGPSITVNIDIRIQFQGAFNALAIFLNYPEPESLFNVLRPIITKEIIYHFDNGFGNFDSYSGECGSRTKSKAETKKLAEQKHDPNYLEKMSEATLRFISQRLAKQKISCSVPNIQDGNGNNISLECLVTDIKSTKTNIIPFGSKKNNKPRAVA